MAYKKLAYIANMIVLAACVVIVAVYIWDYRWVRLIAIPMFALVLLQHRLGREIGWGWGNRSRRRTALERRSGIPE